VARLVDAELIARARSRRERRPGRRERWTTLTAGAAFLAIATPLATLPTARDASLIEAAVLTCAFALASLIEFEAGTGMAVPTQLVFVPMLFLLPTGAVPAAVAAGYLLGEAVRAVHTRTPMARPTMLLGSSWFAVGPAVVLLLAGEGPPAWGRLPVYVLAFASQFACDTGATVARDAVLGVRTKLSLRALAWAYAVDAMLSPVGIVFALVALHRPAAVLAILPLLGVLAWFARDRRAHIDALIDLNSTYRGTALVLGDVIEADDSYTGAHSRHVLALATAIADELGLDEAGRRAVEFTALLHDVGKLRIPKELIRKTGPLTPEERALVETHTIEGERMLAGIGGYLSHVGTYVRACHERFDGRGYPDGLAGEAIPIAARIVFTCDAFDAMTTDRPYRRARPAAEALAEMRACAGSQFDPRAVAALETVLADALEGDEPERRAA
jgi:HD-GYP domain-containing protein (c-di-GMP phosphodiesterase class II)